MKPSKILLGLVLLALCIPSAAQVHVLTDTNGVLRAPPEFFSRNTNALVSALQSAGYSPSGTNNVQKTGEQRMVGPLKVLNSGTIAFGDSDVGESLLMMQFLGGVLELGPANVEDAGIPTPWLTASAVSADWIIPLSAPTLRINGTNILDLLVSKSGGTMSGNLAIVNQGGVGTFGLGGTNNPAAPLVVMAYDGSQFELGDGSDDPLLVNNPWLIVTDGNLATWTTPLVAPSFTGEGGGLTAANPATNATQFVTLAQLQQASPGGQASYFDLSNPANGFGGLTSSTTNRNSLVQVSTVTTNPAVALATNNYVAFFISTNTYAGIADGLAVVTLFCYEESAGSPTVKPEIYLINATTLQVEHEYEPSPAYQTVPSGLGGLVFSVPITDRQTGTNVYVAVGIKQGASGTVRLVTGGAYNSHVTFPIPTTLMVLKSGDTMTGPLTLSATEAPGSSNRIAATTEFVAKALHGVTGGGGTGNADTNSANGWSQRQTFAGGIDAPGTNNLGVIHVTGIESDTAIAQSIGGTGGTDAESARAALGLQYDVDVQAYYPALKQLVMAMLAEGHMPWRNAAGVVTNTPSLAFGRSVLNTADAAAVRALIGAVYGSGDTMSGALQVPYIAIVAGQTNVGSNQVATVRAVAEVEQRVSVGGYISSLSEDFENVAGELRMTNTTGTGPILRQSAAGTNAQLAGLTDVTVSTPIAGQTLVYDGSKWRNSIASPMDNADQWAEVYTPIFGVSSSLATSLGQWTSYGISSGTAALVSQFYGRNGVVTLSPTATGTFTGAAVSWLGGGGSFNPTNTFQLRSDLMWVLTDSVIARIGFTDQFSTNLPTDCVEMAGTNGLIVGEASQGDFGNRTQTATSFQCLSNVWYVARVMVTNSTAWFRLYTNRTQLAWEDSVASNVPGTGQLVGPGISAQSSGSASTNKILMGVDTIGFRYSVQ